MEAGTGEDQVRTGKDPKVKAIEAGTGDQAPKPKATEVGTKPKAIEAETEADHALKPKP